MSLAGRFPRGRSATRFGAVASLLSLLSSSCAPRDNWAGHGAPRQGCLKGNCERGFGVKRVDDRVCWGREWEPRRPEINDMVFESGPLAGARWRGVVDDRCGPRGDGALEFAPGDPRLRFVGRLRTVSSGMLYLRDGTILEGDFRFPDFALLEDTSPAAQAARRAAANRVCERGNCEDGVGRLRLKDTPYTWEGTFAGGRLSGRGIRESLGGEVFTGEFRDGEPVSPQTASTRFKGCEFEGQHIAGEPRGTGTLRAADMEASGELARLDPLRGGFQFGRIDAITVKERFASWFDPHVPAEAARWMAVAERHKEWLPRSTCISGDCDNGLGISIRVRCLSSERCEPMAVTLYSGGHHEGKWAGSGRLVVAGHRISSYDYLYEGQFAIDSPHGKGRLTQRGAAPREVVMKYGDDITPPPPRPVAAAPSSPPGGAPSPATLSPPAYLADARVRYDNAVKAAGDAGTAWKAVQRMAFRIQDIATPSHDGGRAAKELFSALGAANAGAQSTLLQANMMLDVLKAHGCATGEASGAVSAASSLRNQTFDLYQRLVQSSGWTLDQRTALVSRVVAYEGSEAVLGFLSRMLSVWKAMESCH